LGKFPFSFLSIFPLSGVPPVPPAAPLPGGSLPASFPLHDFKPAWIRAARGTCERAGRGAQRVCGRSGSAVARRRSAREQRGRAWRTRRWPGACHGGGGASVRRLQQPGAGPTRGGGPAGGLARSRRRTRVSQQAMRGQARSPVVRGAEREWRAGAAARRGGPAGGCAGMPAVFPQHTRVSRGGSVREQEDPAVRGGVGIASRSGSIISSQGSTTSSSSYPSPITQARPHHLEEAPRPPHRASSTPSMPEHHRRGQADCRHVTP
jgi:hypothetical protein